MSVLGLDPRSANHVRNRTFRQTIAERWLAGVVGAIGLLTFFFPLISFNIPIVGEQNYSGYDLLTSPDAVGKRLDSARSQQDPDLTAKGIGNAPAQEKEIPSVPPIPLSIRLAIFLPLFILAAFISALSLVIDAFFNFGCFKISSGAGAVFGIAAILHVTVMASDMRSMLQSVINSSAQELKGNPFAGLAESLSTLMINSFRVRPGIGLWVLGISLTLVAVVVQSRLLQRFRLVPAEVRPETHL